MAEHPPRAETEADRKLIDDVARHGWHVIQVPERGRTPGWAFSIGLYETFRHAEVIVFGRPLGVLTAIVENIARDVAEGAVHPAQSTSDRILEGYRCAFRPVAERWYRPFLGYASWYYAGRSFPVLQCLWPDRAGRLPDDPRFDPDLVPLQPLLEHASPTDARVEALLHSLDLV